MENMQLGKSTYLVTLLLLCVSLMAGAQTRRQIKDSHRDFIYLTGAGGYESLLNQDQTLSNGPGAGLEFGVGYRMYHYHFLFQLGAEAKWGTYRVGSLNESMSLKMVDSQNDPFTMNVKINDRSDKLSMFDLNVPLMVGGEWSHVYFLMGAKFGLNLAGTAVTSALVSTTGTYDRFSEDFEGMPNHQFYSNQELTSQKQTISFRPQVLGTFEVGYRMGAVHNGTGADVPKSKIRYYVAAFAEYGFLNLHKAGNLGDPVTMTETPDGLQFQVRPVYNAAQYANATFSNWMVGVKFTVAFELPKQKICVICQEPRPNISRFKW